MGHSERHHQVDREACQNEKVNTHWQRRPVLWVSFTIVNPKLALHLVDEVDKRVGAHNVREGLNG